jgi:hypothetical protein
MIDFLCRCFIVIVSVALIVWVGYVLGFVQPVSAEANTKQAADECEELVTLNTITTYQCWDLDGEPYLENTMGFISR